MSLVLVVLSLVVTVAMANLQDPDTQVPDQKVKTGTKVGMVTVIVLLVLFFGASMLGAVYFKYKKMQAKTRGVERDVEAQLYRLPDHEARAHGAGRHCTQSDTIPRSPPAAIVR